MPGAGVGECSQGTGRVQNKEFSGSKVWGRSIRIEGGPMDKIGLAEKSPPETRGGEIANLDRGIKAVESGSGGRDLEIGIRAERCLTVGTKQNPAFSVSTLLLSSF